MESQTATGQLTITRTFNAPRELVWRAWTDPELYKQWWGPNHFACPAAKLDVRVGGKYHSCMRSPDGQDFWTAGVYQEITPYERIVFTDSFADEQGNVVPASYYGMPEMPLQMLVTVTFEERDGKTTMTLVHTGLPAGEHSSNAKEGWSQSFDKLAALVEKG